MNIFIHYILERERIRLRRLEHKPWPWTTDTILRDRKFTNVHRKHDRTTQELVRIYDLYAGEDSASNVLMHCATYRLFGTVGAAKAIGWMRPWRADRLLRSVRALAERGEQVFTGAYIVANGCRAGPKDERIVFYLKELSCHVGVITHAMHQASSWKVGHTLMLEMPGFGGGFLAKEALQDYLLTPHGRYISDADTWTPVGLGAKRGLNRLHKRPLTYHQRDEGWTAEVLALKEWVDPVWKAEMPDSPPLSAHDVQFCLCEYDKYLRVKLGQGRTRSRYLPPEQCAGACVHCGDRCAHDAERGTQFCNTEECECDTCMETA